ncbi:MAG: hypothetical protein K0Q95_1721 [Bacteroidota bacterium]|jgi:hypothetical protein|nr:hypothetical protein [Bacteroidota bacterium]
MSLKKIIAAGTLSTSAMTAYSYFISKRKGIQVREPQLLKKVIKRTVLRKEVGMAPAWLLHYGVGYLFVTGYEKIWKRAHKPPTLLNGSILGALSGILAIYVWKTVLKATLSIRPVFRKSFFLQLFIAHVIFGATAAIGYRQNLKISSIKEKDPH